MCQKLMRSRSKSAVFALRVNSPRTRPVHSGDACAVRARWGRACAVGTQLLFSFFWGTQVGTRLLLSIHAGKYVKALIIGRDDNLTYELDTDDAQAEELSVLTPPGVVGERSRWITSSRAAVSAHTRNGGFGLSRMGCADSRGLPR